MTKILLALVAGVIFTANSASAWTDNSIACGDLIKKGGRAFWDCQAQNGSWIDNSIACSDLIGNKNPRAFWECISENGSRR